MLKEKLLKHGFSIENKKLDELVKDYNNYRMPIGELSNLLIESSLEFNLFLIYIEEKLPKPEKSFWGKIKELFKKQ